MAVIVWGLVFALVAPAAKAQQNIPPTGGTTAPGSCPQASQAQVQLPEEGPAIAERKRFNLFCAKGMFLFEQIGSNLELLATLGGYVDRTVFRLNYNVKLKRRPLDNGRRWRTYYRNKESVPMFRLEAAELSFFAANNWSLPKRKKAFRYLLHARLTLSAADGTTQSAVIKQEILPVGNEAPPV